MTQEQLERPQRSSAAPGQRAPAAPPAAPQATPKRGAVAPPDARSKEEQRREGVVARYGLKAHIQNLDDLAAGIAAEEEAAADTRRNISLGEWDLEVSEAKVRQATTGSNAEERKANLTLALDASPEHSALREQIATDRRDLEYHEALAGKLKRQHRAVALRVESINATISYLAGGKE